MGNAFRGDDAAGLEVAGLLAGTLPEGVGLLEREGEPTALIDCLERAEALWLVDATRSGAPVGTVHRLDAGEEKLPGELFHASTHAFGLGEAVELARELGRLPPRTIVFGIEGARFEAGDELSPEVAAAARKVADAVREEVSACMSRR